MTNHIAILEAATGELYRASLYHRSTSTHTQKTDLVVEKFTANGWVDVERRSDMFTREAFEKSVELLELMYNVSLDRVSFYPGFEHHDYSVLLDAAEINSSTVTVTGTGDADGQNVDQAETGSTDSTVPVQE